MRRQGGGAALTVGKSKARIYSQGSTGVKFSDIAGVDEAKTELQQIVDFLKNKVSIGASDDIQKATELGERAVIL